MATSNSKNQSSTRKSTKTTPAAGKTKTNTTPAKNAAAKKTGSKMSAIKNASITSAGTKTVGSKGSASKSTTTKGAATKSVSTKNSSNKPAQTTGITTRSANTKSPLRIHALNKNTDTKKRSTIQSKHPTVTACIVTGIVCAFAGLLVGFYLLGSGFSMTGRTSISEAELDQPVGLYIVNGIPNFISAREVLDSGNGLAQYLQDDGTYIYPTAEEVLAAVRTAVLNGEVTARGITISDEDMKDYAEDQLGTSDYSYIANYYGLDEASVKTFVRQAVGINKLRQEITGVADQLAPTAPEQGQDAASYKSYILNLLGDNWDEENNSWANEDNDYYEALGGSSFNPDAATYEQASTAYGIASEKYQSESAEAANTWNDFVNNVLKNCQVRIGEATI